MWMQYPSVGALVDPFNGAPAEMVEECVEVVIVGVDREYAEDGPGAVERIVLAILFESPVI